MERKIGEIFEYEGEWYQCLKSASCDECAFINSNCTDNPSLKCSVDDRNDNCSVIFKKLEKVGEPFISAGILYQHYKVFDIDNVCGDGFWCVHNYKAKTLTIELKQNKEDMEDLDKIKVRDYTKVEELNVMEENKLNLKPFDIQKARSGKPVCTRDGRKARIICFDKADERPIVALISDNGSEFVYEYLINGKCYESRDDSNDLMMLPEKHEGWINIVKNADDYYYCKGVFDSEEHARNNEANYPGLAVATVKIEWEE